VIATGDKERLLDRKLRDVKYTTNKLVKLVKMRFVLYKDASLNSTIDVKILLVDNL
jgi:CRISPR/Cas system Type II protein with McrA/HNH and RuvC-like nuclease domain